MAERDFRKEFKDYPEKYGYDSGNECWSGTYPDSEREINEEWVEELLNEIDHLRSLLREKEKRER